MRSVNPETEFIIGIDFGHQKPLLLSMTLNVEIR